MGSKEGVISGIVIVGHQEADLFAGSPGADMLRAVGKDFHPAGSGTRQGCLVDIFLRGPEEVGTSCRLIERPGFRRLLGRSCQTRNR